MNSARILTAVGGNLFRLAMLELGDATQWSRIAGLNGLLDPELDGVVTVRVPARDTQAGGGLVRG